MKATELIGKKAIRTAPTKEIHDRSYSDHPIIIKDANDHYIIFEYGDKWHRTYMDTDIHMLGYDFCDNNWEEFKYNI